MGVFKKIKAKRNGTRVVLPCRVSFVHLSQPWAGAESNEPKYSVSCIVDNSDADTIRELKAAYGQALEVGVAKVWKGKKPNTESVNFKKPLKEGDKERPDDAAYAGSLFFHASSKKAVPVLNRLCEEVDADKVYSGCYALVSVNFFPYAQGSNGVSAGLNSVLFYADGEKLGGSGDGRRDFDDIEGLDEVESLDDL